MLKKTYNSFVNFAALYFYPIIFGLGFLISLSYCFTAIDANHAGGIIYRGVLSFIILLISIPLIVNNWKTINKWFVLLSCVFIVCNLVATFVSPVIIKSNIDYLNSFLGISSSLLIVVSVFLYASLDKTEINEKIFKITSLCFIGLVVLMCLYTYIFEYKDIYNSIFNEYGWNYDVTSIFKIKTEYGNYLLVGSLLSFIYFYKYKKNLLFLAFVFFFINMFISRSKTSIVASIPLLILFLIILIKRCLLLNKKITIISCAISLCIFVTIVMLCAFNVGVFRSINFFLKQTIINDGVVVIKARFENWSHALSQVKNFFGIMFGYGERIGPKLVSGSGDNYYIYSFISGGIVRLVLYILLIIFNIVLVVKSKELSKLVKGIVITLQVLVLLVGLTDTVGVVGFTYTSIFFGFIFFGIKNMFKTENKKVE